MLRDRQKTTRAKTNACVTQTRSLSSIHNAANESGSRKQAGGTSLSHRLDVAYFPRVFRAARKSGCAPDDYQGTSHTGRLHLHQYVAKAPAGRAAEIYRRCFRVKGKNFPA